MTSPGGELTNQECPTRELWIEFSLGGLDRAAQDALLAHRRTCGSCQATLDDLGELRDELVEGLRRPPEVDSRLQDSAFLDLMARLPALLPAPTVPRADFHDPPLERLGRYQILKELGRGGFGLVYLAFDAQLERHVALKVPLERDQRRHSGNHTLAREGRAAAGLNHPHILPIHDAGEIDDVPFIAMAYCPGPTLGKWLKEQSEPVSVPLAAQLVASLADAIQHANDHHVLHRDLKPSNILLDPVTGGDPGSALTEFGYIPKLTDFGLAKVITPGATDLDRDPTVTGVILGTLAYMAPEQASGRSREADVRTDVYGLGAVLYHLLTDRPPFRGSPPLETLRRIENDDPLPPSALRSGLPRDLETICLKCLAKRPDRRYATAGLLAEDLRRHLNGEPIRARPVGWPEATWKRIKRRPVLALLGLIPAGAVAAGLGLHTRNRWLQAYSERLQTALDRAERGERELGLELYRTNVNLAWQVRVHGVVGDFHAILDRCRPRPGLGVTGDPRGIEWALLKSLADVPRHRRIEHAHAGGASRVRFSPDGSRLATSGLDGLVKLWDLESGSVLRIFMGHEKDVNNVVFAPDGGTLASAGDDGTVRIWDVRTGAVPHVLRDFPSRMFHLAYSTSGRSLAAAGRNGHITVWDPDSGTVSLRIRLGDVRGLAFSPARESYLASAHLDGSIRIWELPTDAGGDDLIEPAVTLLGHTGQVNEIAFSADGWKLASAGHDRSARIWDLRHNVQEIVIEVGRWPVTCLAVTPDLSRLATSGLDFAIRQWDGRGEFAGNDWAPVHRGRIWSLAYDQDARILAGSGEDGAVTLLDCQPIGGPLGKQYLRGIRSTPFRYFSPSPDGRVLAVTAPGLAFRLVDLETRETIAALGAKEDAQRVNCLAYSSDGRFLVTGCSDSLVEVWDLAKRERVRRLPTGVGPIEVLASSPNRDRPTFAATNLETGRPVSLWDKFDRDRPILIPWPIEGSGVTALAFSPDGRTLAIGGSRGLMILWDLARRRPRATWNAGREAINDVDFSEDGHLMATTDSEGHVKIWVAGSGTLIHDCLGHINEAHGLAFSRAEPNAGGPRTLVSGAAGGGIWFWQVETGQELFHFSGHHSGPVVAAAFTPDGRTLITGSFNPGGGEVSIWKPDPSIK
ncbi:MAG: protein kinase [Isosphaeraceae bacterium]